MYPPKNLEKWVTNIGINKIFQLNSSCLCSLYFYGLCFFLLLLFNESLSITTACRYSFIFFEKLHSFAFQNYVLNSPELICVCVKFGNKIMYYFIFPCIFNIKYFFNWSSMSRVILIIYQIFIYAFYCIPCYLF